MEGPSKEVMFPQKHQPGEWCASDFTHMSELEITIQGQRFPHLIYRFKRAVGQALLLRGSRDFTSREEYAGFLRGLFRQLNSGRQERFQEECRVLRFLPERRLNDCKRQRVKVGPSSTIRVQHNVYSVPSGLIGEWVESRLYAEQVEVWYGQRLIERMPRLRGEENHRINYRHIIDSLVRKPGAFAQYRYRDDLFPTSRYRMAYNVLQKTILNFGNIEDWPPERVADLIARLTRFFELSPGPGPEDLSVQ
jgi:hypothetical protein